MDLNSWKETWDTVFWLGDYRYPESSILPKVEYLINAEAGLNLSNTFGTTALMHAAKIGYPMVVEKLIAAGADIDLHDQMDKTALIYAAENGYPTIVEKLIVAGANVDFQGRYDDTALIAAVRKRKTEVVDKLLAANANVNLCGAEDNTALMRSAENGDIEILEKLLDAGAEVDLKTDHGWTALMYAAFNAETEIVEKLIAVGASVDIKNKEGETIRGVASRGMADCVRYDLTKDKTDQCERYKKIIAILDKAEKKKEDQKNWNESWAKIDWQTQKDAEILTKVSDFVDKGYDINLESSDNRKNTPLMFAISFDKLETAKFLIDKKADVNHKNSMGFTPLMAAAIKGNTEIVQKLLDAKADMAITRKGFSALDMAKKYGHEDIAKLLTPKAKKLSVLAKSRAGGRT